MSEKEQPPMMDQKLCVAGCGFFGSSQTSQMCSKCWKDSMSKSMLDTEGKKDSSSSVAASPLPPLTKPTAMDESSTTGTTPPPSASAEGGAGAGAGSEFSDASSGSSSPTPMATAASTPLTPQAAAPAMAAAADTAALPEQKNRKRCFTCSKKVGYTGIACRCNYVFCSLHRYPEQHDCTFDFKTSDRNDLKRTVVGGGQFSKVDRL